MGEAKTVRAQLNTMARDCYAEADGNWEIAAREMQKKINPRSKLYRRWVEGLVREAIWYMVRKVSMDVRRGMGPAQNPDAGAEHMERIVGKARQELLDFPLRGGLKLRHATRSLLREEAIFAKQIGRTNTMKGFFLDSIAEGLPNDKKEVGDVYSEEKLQQLSYAAERKAPKAG